MMTDNETTVNGAGVNGAGVDGTGEIGTTVNSPGDEHTAVPIPAEPPRELTPQAQRALAEAEARRQTLAPADRPREIGGQAGPDPVRYGDWEKGGIASDF
jgi:hypothetical protein